MDYAASLAQSSSRFGSVTVASSHACATTVDGTTYCWGDNDYGQLGNGTKKDRLTPVPVSGGLKFKKLVHGGSASSKQIGFFMCGLVTDGLAQCWGNNDLGQLGDGTRADRLVPTPVAGGLTFADLRAGPSSVCGLTNGGKLFCWGAVTMTFLGPGSRQAMTLDKPTEIPLPGSAKPTRLFGDGLGDPCVLADDGLGYCWNAEAGALLVASVTPIGKAFQSVNISGFVRRCGVTTTNELLCWMDVKADRDILLGPGGVSGREPTPAGFVTRFQSLAPDLRFREIHGGYEPCAVTVDGKVWCIVSRGIDTPVLTAVAKDLTVSSLHLGLSGRCVLTTTGEVYCWSSSAAPPARISQGLTFSSLSIEGANACAVGIDGTIYCWGYNAEGQVGDGTRKGRDTPVALRFQ